MEISNGVKLINLTPHDIVMMDGIHEIVCVIPPNKPARVSVEREVIGIVNGFSVAISVFGAVVDLPPPVDNTAYIVSRMVAEACPTRLDLLMVDGTVRDEGGRIIGATGFSVLK